MENFTFCKAALAQHFQSVVNRICRGIGKWLQIVNARLLNMLVNFVHLFVGGGGVWLVRRSLGTTLGATSRHWFKHDYLGPLWMDVFSNRNFFLKFESLPFLSTSFYTPDFVKMENKKWRRKCPLKLGTKLVQRNRTNWWHIIWHNCDYDYSYFFENVTCIGLIWLKTI